MKSSAPPDLAQEHMQQLIVRCRSGDSIAFCELMKINYSYTYAVALKLLRDDDKATNAAHEAFVRVWRNLTTYNAETRFTTWLYKIVVNLCYDTMKVEGRRRAIFGFFEDHRGDGTMHTSSDLFHEIASKDLVEHALRAAETLPPKQRLVFHLRDVEDLSLEEISDVTSMTVESIKVNLCYARRKIRERLRALETGALQ